MLNLDLDLVRTFVLVAEASGFTAAGQSLGATQSAVSVRIRKLEERLGQRLLERSARKVALTGFGETFLPDARRLLAVHDDTVRRATAPGRSLHPVTLGVSDHAAGATLTAVLARLKRVQPALQLRVSIGLSDRLEEAFARKRFDAVIVRRDLAGKAKAPAEGTILFRDRLHWMAAPDLVWRPGDPLPLLALAAPCRVRDRAIAVLEQTGIAWFEAFAGGGIPAVQAALAAGLGIACLDGRNQPPGVRLLAADDGLPVLPASAVVLLSRPDPALDAVMPALAAAFRAAG